MSDFKLTTTTPLVDVNGTPIEQMNTIQLLNKPSTLQPHQVMKLWREKPAIFFQDVMDVKLDSWQEDVIELYRTHQRVALVASKGPGKSQCVSSELYTPKGKVRFGDIKPGDEVFSEYGTPTKVLSIHPQGIRPIYKVTFDDDSFAECDIDHLWKVQGMRKGKWEVITTKEIMERGLTKGKPSHHYWQIPIQGAAHFPLKALPLHPYVLGVWIGDGTRNLDSFHKNDVEVEERIKSLGYDTLRFSKEGECDRVRVIGILPHLKELKISTCYAYEKFIPEEYKTSSIEQRKELLYGLMDTDGTIDKRDGCMEYNTTSEQLAKDVQWLVRSLGGKSTIRTKRPFLNGVEHRLCYRVRVTLPFNPFTLPRKAEYWHAPTQNRYLARTIKNIEYVRDEEAMCISVECPNHCYLTNDFIVTHNTFTLAMLGWHFFITHHQPKIAAISISKEHLMANLWAELLKWRAKSPLLKASTNEGFSKITLKGHEGYSFIDARAYPKSADETQQASALAGLHSDFVAFLIDEAGSIPDSVIATADAALSTGDGPTKRARLLVTANPEEPKGIIYKAYMGRSIQKWAVYTISGDPDDPRRAPRVSINWAKEQIATYGRDNPWIMVNVLGKYPNVATEKLISEEEVFQAMKRDIKEEEVKNSQHRLGLDVARGGIDNSALARRRGLKAYPIEGVPSSVLGPELAGKVAFMHKDYGVERVFVDNTGGFGGSVIDSLSMFPEIDVTPIHYNGRPQDKRYYNKRTEMWVRMRDWIKKGGALPNDPQLAEELLMPKVFFQNGVFRLEEKEQIKSRLGRSPDKADALAQTFADVEQTSFNADFSRKGEDGRTEYYKPKAMHSSDPEDNFDYFSQHHKS